MDVLSYLLGKNAGGGAKGLKVEVVETLPQTGESNVLYLVPKQTAETSNVFDEYLYINNAWEKIGTTDIDLSGYVTDEELLQALATKQNTLTPGDNITIENNVISASGEEKIIINDSDTTEINIEKLQSVYDKYLNGELANCELKSDSYAIKSKLISIYNYYGTLYFTFGNHFRDSSLNEIVYNYIIAKSSNNAITSYTLHLNARKSLIMPFSNLVLNDNKVLTTGNSGAYTPTAGSYNPATAKYAEDQAEAVKVQYSTMPTASADNLGKIVQYTGTNDSTYTNGHFYIVVSDGETEPTYSWEEISLGGGDCVGTVITQEDIDSMNQEYNPDWVGTNATTPAFVFVRYGTGIYKFTDSVSMRWGKSDRNGINSSAGAILIVTSNGYQNIYISQKQTNYDYLMTSYSTTFSTTPATVNTDYAGIALNSANIFSNLFQGRYMTPLNSLPNAKALATNNIQSYTPTGNYHPATKLSSETVPLTLSGLSAYDSSTTYQVGDYVYRSATDLTIYKCNTADTTGTWDSTLWDSKTYIEYLKDALNQ